MAEKHVTYKAFDWPSESSFNALNVTPPAEMLHRWAKELAEWATQKTGGSQRICTLRLSVAVDANECITSEPRPVVEG